MLSRSWLYFCTRWMKEYLKHRLQRARVDGIKMRGAYTPTASQSKLQMPARVFLEGSGKALEQRSAQPPRTPPCRMTLRSWLMPWLMKLLQIAQKENSKGCVER